MDCLIKGSPRDGCNSVLYQYECMGTAKKHHDLELVLITNAATDVPPFEKKAEDHERNLGAWLK